MAPTIVPVLTIFPPPACASAGLARTTLRTIIRSPLQKDLSFMVSSPALLVPEVPNTTPEIHTRQFRIGASAERNGARGDACEIIGRTLELSPCSNCIIERLLLGLRVSGSGSSAAQTTI